MRANFRLALALFVMAIAVSGCSAVSTLSNLADGYRAANAYSSAKSVAGKGQGVLSETQSFQFKADLRPRDEEQAEEIEETFEESLTDRIARIADEAELDFKPCNENCGEGAMTIQFDEKGRAGFIESLIMGNTIKGELYFARSGEVVEGAPFDGSEDYGKAWQMIERSVMTRIVMTRSAQLQKMHEEGEVTEEERQQKVQALTDRINALSEGSPAVPELLVGKS